MQVVRFITLFAILLIYGNSIQNSNSITVEYYENIIRSSEIKALSYKLPEKKGEFTEGTKSAETNDGGSYDFIIIGAGSAGSVLATRLSEIEEWKILLLEAGGEEDDINKIPAMASTLQFSEKNWGYFSTPQKNCCLGMKDNRCILPQGKGIGGTSAINGLMYVRGNAKDFDKWVELGNPGWSYQEVLPYFIKSENSQIDGDPFYHGKGSLLNVEYASFQTHLLSTFFEASAELNRSLLDYNGQIQIGDSDTQFNIKHGKRQSTGTAFLDSARRRANLKVITNALVTKIVIDSVNKVAQGVEFVKNDSKYVATAAKEIIVSAGAFNSPQLLMLSGVGPQKHLRELDIPVIEDLPVGENLLEHPNFLGLVFHTDHKIPQIDISSQIKQYLEGVGPLTSTLGIQGMGFVHAGHVPENVPMIEYVILPLSEKSVKLIKRVFNFNDNLINNYLDKINPGYDFIIYMLLLHQKSKGRVTLKSKDPLEFPLIDLNFFSHPEDVDNMIKGIEFALNLTQTEAFQKIGTKLVDIPICQEFGKYSKDYWNCAIRHMTMGVEHLYGTCAMGPNKLTAVVDTNLKVHGIDKLRVVDGGVIPTTTSGNTNIPIIMIAEKISDLIKHYYLQLLI